MCLGLSVVIYGKFEHPVMADAFGSMRAKGPDLND